MNLNPSLAVMCFQLLWIFCTTGAKDIKWKIKLRLYRGGSDNFEEVFIEKGLELVKERGVFNTTTPVVFIIHGMAMGADSPFVNGVVDALVERSGQNSYNILSVDMPELLENRFFNNFYFGVLSKVQPAGKEIGAFLNQIVKSGLTTPAQINLIGYSIGAQVAGYAARAVKRTCGKINYIAGLDPAGPGFHPLFGRVPGLIHVSRKDAKITHFFHTNSISCGTRDRVGSADFVFNNGGIQPGCIQDASFDCSHIRVPYLYIEALLRPEDLVARRCNSWSLFAKCQCDHQDTALITFPPDQRVRGLYYLRTRARSPFGLGQAGSQCNKNDIDTSVLKARHQSKERRISDLFETNHLQRLNDNVNVRIIKGIKSVENFESVPKVSGKHGS